MEWYRRLERPVVTLLPLQKTRQQAAQREGLRKKRELPVKLWKEWQELLKPRKGRY